MTATYRPQVSTCVSLHPNCQRSQFIYSLVTMASLVGLEFAPTVEEC